jgi:hypothetical protein
MIINKNPILIPLVTEKRRFLIGKDSFFSISFLLLVIKKLSDPIVKKIITVNFVILLELIEIINPYSITIFLSSIL